MLEQQKKSASYGGKDMSINPLILKLIKAGAISSGPAGIGLNLRTPDHPTRPGSLTPELIKETGEELWATANSKIAWGSSHDSALEFDGVCAIPHTAEPYARAFCNAARSAGRNLPMLTLEKKLIGDKPRFTGLMGDGGLTPGSLVLLLDDTTKSRNAQKRAAEVLRAEGFRVRSIVVFCILAHYDITRLREEHIVAKSFCTLGDLAKAMRRPQLVAA